jgi:hypothetical protein
LLLTPMLAAACPDTPVLSRCDLAFDLTPEEVQQHPNPYLSVRLLAEFKSPRAKTLKIEFFPEGPGRLVLRLTPTEPGLWTYKLTSNLNRLDGQEGSLQALESPAPGHLQPANVHHWRTMRDLQPHLWMGDNLPALANLPGPLFEELVRKRAAQKFTHLRAYVLGVQPERAYADPDHPNAEFFRELDYRVGQLNAAGIVVDLVLGGPNGELPRLFPRPDQRERYLRYVIARFAGFSITWQGVERFESYPNGRALLKEIMTRIKTLDPYSHLRTTGTEATSAALLADGWMNVRSYARTQDLADSFTLPAVEHQLYPTPALALEAAIDGGSVLESRTGRKLPGDDPVAFRRRLWRATMAGPYVYYTHAEAVNGGIPKDPAYLDSPQASVMTHWFDVMSQTRFWDLRPHFDVDGGRGLALPTVEYLVYVERASGPIEVVVEKAGYEVVWINPTTGERLPQKGWRGDKFTGEPPDRERDWLLHLSRDGRKEGMRKAWRFEYAEQPILMQEIDAIERVIPFTVEQPKESEMKVGIEYPFQAVIKRPTRATREMFFVWLVELPADGQGYRVAGTGAEGRFRIPPELARTFPGVVSLRLYGMNANGKVYVLDRAVPLSR